MVTVVTCKLRFYLGVLVRCTIEGCYRSNINSPLFVACLCMGQPLVHNTQVRVIIYNLRMSELALGQCEYYLYYQFGPRQG